MYRAAKMTELRLNLGCGLNAPVGWINIDRSPNVLLQRAPAVRWILRRLRLLDAAHMADWPANIVRRDLRQSLPYADRSVSAIYSSHAIEHLYLDDARRLLAECRRVLRPQGVLRLALPDAMQWAKDLLEEERADQGDAGLVFNERLAAHPFSPPSTRRRVLGVIGSSTHRWQPTEGLVVSMLHDAGFHDARRAEYLESAIADVAIVESRPESLFVEAVAP